MKFKLFLIITLLLLNFFQYSAYSESLIYVSSLNSKYKLFGTIIDDNFVEKKIEFNLNFKPYKIKMDKDSKNIFIEYLNNNSLIEKISIKNGKKSKFFENDKNIVDFSFIPDNSSEIMLSLSNSFKFSTSEIAIMNLKTEKKEVIIGGNDNFFYNYIRFINSDNIIFTRSFIPDVKTPKYSTMEIVQYNLKNKSLKIITGGKTSYDEKGKSTGFKATVPQIINDFKIGFMKIVDNFDKFYSIIELTSKKVKNLYGPDFSMILPKLSGDNLYFIERNNNKTSLVKYNLKLKQKSKISDNVILFLVKK